MEMTKYKLGDVCEIFGRIGFRGYTAQDLVESPKDGAITLSPTNIVNGELDFTNSTYLSWDKYEESPEIKINENDIVVVKTASVGKCALVRKLPHPTTLNPQFVVLKKIQADPVYLSYIIKGRCFQSSLKAITAGSVVPTLSQKHMADIEIYLPDLKIQKKIASVLSALDDKIALNKKMNQKLEAMAKRLYDYWFVQYDFPDKNGHPYKTTGGKMEYNPTLKREIPEGWTDGVLSDIANITMGQSPDGSSYNEDGEGMIFYQGCTDFGMRFPTARQYTTAPTRFAKKGDILMSVRAPVGAVNIANTDCCIGRGLSALNSKLGSLSHLYFLIDVFKKTFENKNTVGTTFGSITKDELYALPVVIPDKNVIEQFEKMAKPIFDRQMKLGEESNRLTALRDKLLPLLMNGQVTLKSL